MESQNIYDAALQCESLFEQDIAELQSRQDRLNSKGIILVEFLQNSQARFNAWASYMGVFADPDVSLDQRLRISEIIQQMVLDMLEVLRSNLDLLKGLVSQMTTSLLEHECPILHSSDLQELENKIQKAKESIDGSVSRLHRLGATIRQSSTSSLASRVKMFTAKTSTTSLEKKTVLIVSTLYPGASKSLQRLLSRSILDRYFRLDYKQQHQRHLSKRRATDKIDENDIILDTENEKPVEVQPKVLLIRDPPEQKELAPSSKSHGERSKASTLQESQVLNIMSNTVAKSVATSASTVPMTDIQYPKPPKPGSPCDWCGMTFENAKVKDPRWWRKHVDHDLKPYICLAKECLDTEVAFGRYSQWRSHMSWAHSTSWIKDVCTETQWKCDFDNTIHHDEESLRTHMKDSHQDLLTEEQITEVASWSAVPVQPDTERCPLCQCSPLEEPDVPSATDEERTPPPNQSSVGSILRRQRSAGGRRRKRPRVRFHDSQPIKLEDSDSESSGSMEVDNDGSSKQSLNNRMRLERHISSHLKRLSLMSLRLDAFQANEDGEDDEDAGIQSFLHDTSTRGDISGWDSSIDAMSLTFEDAGNEIELPPFNVLPSHDEKPRKGELETPSNSYALMFSEQGTNRLYHPDRIHHIGDNGEHFFYEDNPTTRRHIMEPNGTTIATKIRPAKKTRQELEKAQVRYQLDSYKKFIPRSQYANIMTPERVLEIIYDLSCFHSQTPERKQILAQNICFGSDGQRPALKIFGALIMSNLELEHDISEHLDSGLSDGCLPLKADTSDGADKLYCECKNKNHIETMNSDEYLPSEREGFLRWVRRLTAPYVVYQSKRHSHYVLDLGNCIPIFNTATRMFSPEHKNSRARKNPDSLGGSLVNGGYGGFSEVHRVQLHNSHCRLPDTGLRHSQGYYALKKLTSHDRLDFELKLSSLLLSTDQNGDKRHIIQVLATFEERLIDQSTFYFLFDCAEGPLEYFWQQHESLVGDMSHCLSMSEQFLGLGQTLEAIHINRLFPLPDDLPELRNIPNFQNIYGRHGDIKPSNILYFQPSKGEGRLVLADFGPGRLHTKVSNQDPILLFRPETYHSPEFDIPDGLVGPWADVFSLGCVFLEHIAWFLLGGDFQDRFSDDRLMKDMYGFEVDTFFMLTDQKVAMIKPAVKKWIADLKENEACSWFLVQMLELIEDQMLACDKESRIRATPLVKKLKTLQTVCQMSKTFYMRRWKDCECPVLPERGR